LNKYTLCKFSRTVGNSLKELKFETYQSLDVFCGQETRPQFWNLCAGG